MNAVDTGARVLNAAIIVVAVIGLITSTLRGHAPEAILYAGIAILLVLAWEEPR